VGGFYPESSGCGFELYSRSICEEVKDYNIFILIIKIPSHSMTGDFYYQLELSFTNFGGF